MQGSWTETLRPEQKLFYPTLLKLSMEEIVLIWDAVSNYILQQMMLDKGVLIMGLGTFCVVQEPLRLGAEEVLMVRRPVFKLAMNPACQQYPKVTLPENIEIEPLDFRLLTLATSLPRPVVEDCVDETVVLFSSHMKHMENVSFVFKDIGVLARHGGILQMKFFGSCIEQLETTASLIAALRSRPWLKKLVVPTPTSSVNPLNRFYVFPRFQVRVEGSREARAAPAGFPGGKKKGEDLESCGSSKERRPSKRQQHGRQLCLPMLPGWGMHGREHGAEKPPPARAFRDWTGCCIAPCWEKEAEGQLVPHPPSAPRAGAASAARRTPAQEPTQPALQRRARAGRLSLFQEKAEAERAELEELQARADKRARQQKKMCLLKKQLHQDQHCSPATGQPHQPEVSPRAKQNMQLMASYKVLRDSWKDQVQLKRQRMEKWQEAQRILAQNNLRSQELQDRQLRRNIKKNSNGLYLRK